MSAQTLRDTFAAAALSGLLGSGDINVDPSDDNRSAHVAELAYRWADAILRVRLHMLSAAAPSPPPARTGDTPTFTLTEDERETLDILRTSIAVAAGNEDTAEAERRFAVDAIRVIDALLARLGGGE